MPETRTTHGHRARPLAGGLSLLLLITVAAANSAGGFQPLLAELAGRHPAERSTLRALSDRLVEAVRVARRSPSYATLRPARAWDTASLAPIAPAPTLPCDSGGPPPLVHLALLDLPPPRA